MTREEAQEFLPILQAYADGKTIQYHAIEDGYWYDVTESDDIDPMAFAYRIKPEAKYRPFKNVYECWLEMEKHEPFGWVKDSIDSHTNIAKVYPNAIVVDKVSFFEDAMREFKFVDGSVFGIKEGGEV